VNLCRKKFVVSVDTLYVKKDGTYRRVIYNNQNKLLFKNSSKWDYRGSKIVFSDFLINLDDREFYNENVKYDDVLITNYSSVESMFFTTKIIIDKDLKFYYEKNLEQ
jgi:hypothetical protein